MKRHELWFGVIKVISDFCTVFISFYVGKKLRSISDFIPGIQLPIHTFGEKEFFWVAISASLFLIILFSIHGMYHIKTLYFQGKEFLSCVWYSMYWFIFFSVFLYFFQDTLYNIQIPRLLLLFSGILSLFGILINRIIASSIYSLFLKKNILPKRNILLIMNKSEQHIAHIMEMLQNIPLYHIVGYIHSAPIKESSLSYLGTKEALENLFSQNMIDEILYIESDRGKSDLLEIWQLTRIYGIPYKYIAHSFDVTQTNTFFSFIGNIPIVEMKHSPLDAWGRIMKRSMDIMGSMLGVCLFFPLFLIIALLIKLEDPSGPVIYRNIRVGQNGKVFFLYKFRYLYWKYCIKDSYGVPPEKDSALAYEKELIEKQSIRTGPLYKIHNDPRKTKIGAFLEKYSLDELPQLWNVLIGNMSLVGPRPHQPREVEKYNLYHKRLLTVKPGITGLAQVNGREHNSFEEEFLLDTWYIENWSLLLDIKILIKTIVIIFQRK